MELMHPNIYRLINALKNEQLLTDQLIIRLETDKTIKKP